MSRGSAGRCTGHAAGRLLRFRMQAPKIVTLHSTPTWRLAVYSLRVLTLCCLVVSSLTAQSQTPYDSTVFAALKWREIGIFRGGRSVAVSGSAARPNEFWMGTTGGGVF